MTTWKPFTGTFAGNDFFLIRMVGIHPARGYKYLPMVAQLIDGELYSIDNEIEALSWGCHDKDGYLYEERNPFKANLEWCPIPE